jgi:squalene-hopene/tetraprenyl-beta-curcumene cyclase
MESMNPSVRSNVITADTQSEDLSYIERRTRAALKATQDYLLDIQHPEGYWIGELEADVSVTAGYIPIMHFMLGQIDPVRQQKVINFVKRKQNKDGSWSTYFDGPGDLDVSAQAYFALKLGRVSAQEPFMVKAREFILAQGGLNRAHVITKIWLALFGQFDWRGTPTVPPEIILLPNWFYVNIYEFASWSRATIMALTIILTHKPICSVPEYAQIPELYVEPEGKRVLPLGQADTIISWPNFFLKLDAFFKVWEKLPFKPGRIRALREVEKWIIDRQEADGSWGGIMLPWVYSLFALKSLGYPLDNPAIARGLAGLEEFIIEDSDTLRLQPAVSPVWDTAWTAVALQESGLPADHPALIHAGNWMISKEIRSGGDWQVQNPHSEPGGWAFEFENNNYPDLDDTALVPRALIDTQLSDKASQDKKQAISRALQWILNMQSRDGGWAAFDRDNDKEILAYHPFAEFISPLDPTCPDVTAHVIELLAKLGEGGSAINAALEYLKGAQESDGAWNGRWGVNYLYGTGLVLAALDAAGEDPKQSHIQKAVSWLKSRQNPDGGWGETCMSYEDLTRRYSGPSTASQTAWVLIGLISSGELSSQSVKNGIEYLLRTQNRDGTWDEQLYTGTGFPKVFYLWYELYRIYFPLIALSRYSAGIEKGGR